MVYKATLELDSFVFDALADAYGQAPAQTALQVEKRLVPAVKKRLLTRLQTYPPPKKNSKYKRTGRLKRGYQVDAVLNQYGGEITASNDTPYATYVVGEAQLDYHAETGWEKADDAILDVALFAQDQLVTIWEEVTAVRELYRRR
jgi:hypothetical protein